MSPWIKRFFSAVLFAYPREFRDEYGASMTDHFQSEGGGWANALRTAADVLWSSVGMRFENLWRDLVYAVRMNAKAPLFTGIIVASIALAIGINTVVFALLSAVLLKPLPYANPEQLGLLWQRSPQMSQQTFTTLGSTQTQAVADASKSFGEVTALVPKDSISTASGVELQRSEVMPNYFSVLGVRPMLGAFFSIKPHENDAVISERVWRTHFNRSGNAIGSTMKLGGRAYTVIGVAPSGMLDPAFGTLQKTDVWTPMPHTGSDNQFVVFPIVRLRDGVTWQQAQADLARVQKVLKGPDGPFPGSSFQTGPLDQSIFARARSFFWMVFAAVTGILLIACANVANLLLVRGAVREGEFAVRSAIGASRRRIAGQVFTETLLLAVTGAAIGLAIAWFMLPWAKTRIPGNFPRLDSAGIDGGVLLYVGALIIGVTILTGMLPAYRRARKGERDMATRIRPVLVVIEVAIAFALTVGFGLLLRSFVTMTHVDVGFAPSGVYVAQVHPDHDTVFKPGLAPAQKITAADVERTIRAIPGVQDAAIITSIPFQNSFVMTLLLDKNWKGAGVDAPPAIINASQIGRGYFRLMRIPLIAGRTFNAADMAASSNSIIVNDTFAHTYYPNQNVIGKMVYLDSKHASRIVGVAGDTLNSYKEQPHPLLYFPYNGGFGPYYGLAIRTSGPVRNLAAQVARIVKRAEPGTGPVTVQSLNDIVANDASAVRMSLELLGVLAAVALLLGLCGIYSVVAYGTERRFHEIGIRMAVGARPGDILSLVVRGAVIQGAAGVIAGIVLCALTTGMLQDQLYKTSALDPLTLIIVMLVLIACTAIAAFIPACRAAFSRPSATLRYE